MLTQWYQRVIRYIDERLAPYDEEITRLRQDLEETQRRLRGVVRPGRVIEVHGNGQQIKVAYGRNQTPFIHWFSASAGAVKEYRCPSVGEQCVLLNYGGGDNSTQSWALTGMPSGEFARPSDDPNLHVIDWGGGMRLVVNTATQEVTWDIPKKLTIKTPIIESTAKLITDGDQIAGGVSTRTHKHVKISPNPNTTDEPVK